MNLWLEIDFLMMKIFAPVLQNFPCRQIFVLKTSTPSFSYLQQKLCGRKRDFSRRDNISSRNILSILPRCDDDFSRGFLLFFSIFLFFSLFPSQVLHFFILFYFFLKLNLITLKRLETYANSYKNYMMIECHQCINTNNIKGVSFYYKLQSYDSISYFIIPTISFLHPLSVINPTHF